jgi:outer membrane protein OmpA-like peptidoglycan-associated protein
MLDLFAEYLLETGLKVEIGGHTDDVGNEADNLSLSQQRADAVLVHLTTAGVDREALEARGYGESRPRSDNATEDGRARNRRTEFRILQD